MMINDVGIIVIAFSKPTIITLSYRCFVVLSNGRRCRGASIVDAVIKRRYDFMNESDKRVQAIQARISHRVDIARAEWKVQKANPTGTVNR